MTETPAQDLRHHALLHEALGTEENSFLIKAFEIFRSLCRAAGIPEDRAALGYLIARTCITAGRPQNHTARKRLQAILVVPSKGAKVPFPLSDGWRRLTMPLVASLDAFLLVQLRQEQDAYRQLHQLGPVHTNQRV